MVWIKSNQIQTKSKFDLKLKKMKLKWITDYQSNIQSILDNASLLENGRRTLKPLKHYRKFVQYTGISTRTAQRLVSIGKVNKASGRLTLAIDSLPNSYPTIEILLRLSQAKFNTSVKSGKIHRGMSRKDAHILHAGKDATKEKVLKDKLLDTQPFSNIRIETKYNDTKKVMALLKDLKKLKSKYDFIDYDDRGYVDRLLARLKREEKEAIRLAKEKADWKASGGAEKDREQAKFEKRLFKKKHGIKKGAFKDFKF